MNDSAPQLSGHTPISGNEPVLSSSHRSIHSLRGVAVELLRALRWERENPDNGGTLPDLPLHRLRHEAHVRATMQAGRSPMLYDEWRRFCRRITATQLVTAYGRYRLEQYLTGLIFFSEFWGERSRPIRNSAHDS